MKKFIFSVVFVIFMFSCSFFGATLKVEGEENFNYKKYENTVILTKMREFGKTLVENAKQEVKDLQKEGVKLDGPKMIISSNEYKDKGINSIVFNIFKSIYGANNQNIIKVFHTNDKGEEISWQNILKLDSADKKKELAKKMKEKLKSFEGLLTEDNVIDEQLAEYLENPKFYLEAEKIVFLLEAGTVGPYSRGFIEEEFYFNDLIEYLNQDTFPEIKKELEKLAEQKAKIEKERAAKNAKIAARKNTDGKKYVALTFDDGPSPKTTPGLLEILKKNNVKATFFVLGKNVSAHPEIIQKEIEEGHEVGSHSWDHPALTKLKDAGVKKQIQDTDDALKKAIGKEATLLRPPYGAHNKRTDNIIKKTILMWNVDSMDWKNRNVEKNIETTMKQVKDGSIILYHDIHQPSVDTIDSLIKKLKAEGYNFVTVSELLKMGGHEDLSKKVCSGEFDCHDY
ncbi:polysaccharide deacetylase family protein [Candidatus Gracilibacteria bacterium]|nr:polysaccharide deacetylase family protein [Candidatus Gracilibacteria bacterium]